MRRKIAVLDLMANPNIILHPPSKEEEQKTSKYKYKYPKSWYDYCIYHKDKDAYALTATWDTYEILLKAITKSELRHEFDILVQSGRYPLRIEDLFQEDERYWIQLLTPYFPANEVERRALRMEKLVMKLQMQKIAQQVQNCGVTVAQKLSMESATSRRRQMLMMSIPEELRKKRSVDK